MLTKNEIFRDRNVSQAMNYVTIRECKRIYVALTWRKLEDLMIWHKTRVTRYNPLMTELKHLIRSSVTVLGYHTKLTKKKLCTAPRKKGSLLTWAQLEKALTRKHLVINRCSLTHFEITAKMGSYYAARKKIVE